MRARLNIQPEQRYGALVVKEMIKEISSTDKPLLKWRCDCDCGKSVNVLSGPLFHGRVRSCGCRQYVDRPRKKRTHGLSARDTDGNFLNPAYSTWRAMLQTCNNPKAPFYARFKELGIGICPRWLESAQNFIDDMGPRPHPDCRMFRKNLSKGFDKDNCEWRYPGGIQPRSKQRRHGGNSLPEPTAEVVTLSTEVSSIFNDLTGQLFGRLTALSLTKPRLRGREGKRRRIAVWRCRCDCGNDCLVAVNNLVSGDSTSCGCRRLEQPSPSYIDGRTHSDVYDNWLNIRHRCYSPLAICYKRYRLMGITMCDRWLNSFQAFLEDMGPRPLPHARLHRIDLLGGFYKENMEWR